MTQPSVVQVFHFTRPSLKNLNMFDKNISEGRDVGIHSQFSGKTKDVTKLNSLQFLWGLQQTLQWSALQKTWLLIVGSFVFCIGDLLVYAMRVFA